MSGDLPAPRQVGRRAFLGALGVAIFAPKFGAWYRRGSGLVVPNDLWRTPGTPDGWEAAVTGVDAFERQLMITLAAFYHDIRLSVPGVPLIGRVAVASAADFRPGDVIRFG